MSEQTDRLTERGTNKAEEERNERSGRDIPGGTGVVSDEDVNAISDATRDTKRETGVDHSTEDYGKTMPDHGVGAVQNSSDTTSDIAHIDE
jgi:hypothetical protein